MPSVPHSRRTFLQGLAGASAGLVAFRFFPASLCADENPVALRDNKKLSVLSADPLNAEPALDALVADWITPVEHFYIRTHGTTPELDAAKFQLTVEGMVETPLTLSLDQLKSDFPKAETVATMTCAGNRRTEFNATKKVGGVQWGAGAIGNARWEGVRLSDLLKKAGVKDGARHVWFEGLDSIKHGDSADPFGGSIPLERAQTDNDAAPGALLAFGMNGKPLPIDHGFPLRSVVPGYIGARSVKWLGKIVVSDRPSPNHYLQEAYKILRTERPAELEKASPIYEFPINSAVCIPKSEVTMAPGRLEVRGYALPNGDPGSRIRSVELSTDGGSTWQVARITSPTREFCWALWSAELQIPRGTTEVLVRALDTSNVTQPKRTAWNVKGYLYDAWHRLPVNVRS